MTNKIKVPAEIRYLSDWKEFNFSIFPEKCIINKQIPGCGYTEWCIRNNQNVILCSPRKMLLENKTDQHIGRVYLVRNEQDKDLSVDKSLSEKSLSRSVSNLDSDDVLEKLGFISQDFADDFYNKLYQEINQYCIEMQSLGLSAKILVTYDSYRLVKSILTGMGIFQNFYTVVDEQQTILQDSRFKANTELNFMTAIKDVSKVHFVSATPMLEKYIQMLDDFKDLPYYQLDWGSLNPARVIKPNLKVLSMQSVGNSIRKIIEKYLAGNFERIITGDLKEIVSREAVFYINSVNHIVKVIKACNLQPSQCNILCARTPENEKRIKRELNRGKKQGDEKFTIGSVPLPGQPHKMFTFCTRTVYLGADFYSTCARSFVFSDSNLDCLAVDINQDLPQILGRQRLDENPWKNSADLYVKATADWKKMSKEDFNNWVLEKEKATNLILSKIFYSVSDEAREELLRVYSKLILSENYKNNYIGLHENAKSLEFNNYVKVADIMAFDIQQVDYADRFVVFNKVLKISSEAYESFIDQYSKLTQLSDRVRMLCEEYFKNGMSKLEIMLNILPEDDHAKSLFLTLGPDKCKWFSYNPTLMKREQMNKLLLKGDKLLNAILQGFKENEKMTKAEAKERLAKIYTSIGYGATPKATDLEKWFHVQKVKLGIVNGKQIFGIRLTGYK